MSDYQVRFSALASDPLPGDASDLLRAALESMPGVETVHGATVDHEAQIVTGEFRLEVDQGMAEAARDGSRLAKQALHSSGLPDAKLVEMLISMRQPAE